ncbi:hypothetical protein E0K83_12070 [Gramella sp. BOM4]|nr:hypothetical protein [Christiangramia bathymodioli]
MAGDFQLSKILGGIFGVFLLLIGMMNIFRGNDPGLGVMYMLLSIIFFPVTNTVLHDLFRLHIPYYVKVILAVLCLWSILAVGAIAEGYYPEIIDSL